MARRKRPPLFELARESRVQSVRSGGGSGSAVTVEALPGRASVSEAVPLTEPEPTPAPLAPPSLPPSPAAAAAAESAANDWRRWVTPGRTVRVPVGYVFLGSAALLAVSLGAYLVGFRRGAVARERELVALRGDAALTGPAVDPLHERSGNSPRAGAAPMNARRGGASGGVDAAEAAAALGPVVAGADVGADDADSASTPAQQPTGDPLVIKDALRNPLSSGLNYYIVDRLRPDEALAAARYLRLHGVEAAVFPEHLVFGGQRDSSLRLVVALRGFASGEVSSEAAKRYAARIRDIGRRWRTEENGVSDFSTMYAAKHQP